MKMKKILFAVAFVIFAASSSIAGPAASLDYRQVDAAGFDKLSDVQKIAVIKSVAEQAAAKTEVVSDSTIDKIDRWSQVGANLGKGLAATAKELGVAVNEFAASPIGKVATALIIWHIMGASIMHVVGAILVWILGLVAIRYIMERSCPAKITYDVEKKNIFGNHPMLSKVRADISSEMVAVLLISHVVVLGTGIFIMFTM